MEFRIEAAVCSSIGGRNNNEDNFYLNGVFMEQKQMDKGRKAVCESSQPNQIYAVFDGMGGGDFGEYASFYAASELKKYQDSMGQTDPSEGLHQFLTQTSEGIDKFSADNGLRSGSCGSTAAVVVIGDGWYRTAHVGDSRVYRMRDGKLERLTKDQSAVQRMVDAGEITSEEAFSHPRKNVITHHLGMPLRGGALRSVIGERVPLQPNDFFLICSDGVSDSLRDGEIEAAVDLSKSPEENAEHLVRTAKKRTDEMGVQSDNITAVVLRVRTDEAAARKQQRRVRAIRVWRRIAGACAVLFALGAAAAIYRWVQMIH